MYILSPYSQVMTLVTTVYAILGVVLFSVIDPQQFANFSRSLLTVNSDPPRVQPFILHPTLLPLPPHGAGLTLARIVRHAIVYVASKSLAFPSSLVRAVRYAKSSLNSRQDRARCYNLRHVAIAFRSLSICNI